jgi:gamma-glutamylcyclotransferase (GGCT)/AIG2-like uncharacterized protein YtfP
MSEFLFVYGTLARNAGHEMHRHLAGNADYVSEGHFNGQLYRVAHYPGAVPSSNPDEKVFGELYRIGNHDVLATLDAYEGREFVRKTQPVWLHNGRKVQAWVYLLQRAVTNLPRIASGRFTD